MITHLTHTNGHYKFWEIDVVDQQVFCVWGRIGTAGQSKTFDFVSRGAAWQYANKKISQKLAKGYV